MAVPIVLTSLAEFHRWRARSTQSIHFVPTMGNLHEGHLHLVDVAAGYQNGAARVIVSIFVNPIQFGPNEDFDRYPRTLEQDIQHLTGRGCDAVWVPSVDTMYPYPEPGRISVQAPADLSQGLCAAGRPGHFDGVVNVVLRLFSQISPDVAFFGEKDFQQLQIIRRLAADLSLPVEIHAVPTHREPDGLAMSSRNQYLLATEREIASGLYRVLQKQAEQAKNAADWGTLALLERSGIEQLEALGFTPEYFEFRLSTGLARPNDLNAPEIAGLGPESELRLLAAACLGSTRLIDNVAVARQICR